MKQVTCAFGDAIGPLVEVPMSTQIGLGSNGLHQQRSCFIDVVIVVDVEELP